MKLEIDLSYNSRGVIKAEGVDIANLARSLTLDATFGSVPAIRIELLAVDGASVSVDGDVRIDSIKLPSAMTRDAIVALKNAIIAWELANHD